MKQIICTCGIKFKLNPKYLVQDEKKMLVLCPACKGLVDVTEKVER